MLAINQPRVSHLDRASRICSTISLDKAAAWHSFISGSSSSGLSTDFLSYRSALSNPMSQRRVLCTEAGMEKSVSNDHGESSDTVSG
jgi:hypothetical protein